MCHSADDIQDTQQSTYQERATRGGGTTQQQQKMTDMLQLRSDELSAENARLRMQMARADKQLPAQLQHDNPFSHMSGQQQHEYTAAGSHAALGMQQHASRAGGLSYARPLSTNGLHRAGEISHTDRWDFLHYCICACV